MTEFQFAVLTVIIVALVLAIAYLLYRVRSLQIQQEHTRHMLNQLEKRILKR